MVGGNMGSTLALWNRCSANVCCNKELNRFTLCGRRKPDARWKLFCLVHNNERLAHRGYAA